MKAVIISDHGYDSYCDDLNRYQLGHGDEVSGVSALTKCFI
jgi:hypothetical protein